MKSGALNRLPEVGPDQMRVSGIEVINDPVDFILRIEEINLEMAISVQAQNADIYTSEKTEKILKSKIERCAGGHDVVEGFMRLLELINVPDIENAIISNNLSFDDVLKVRSSRNGTMFREWLQKAEVEEARDLEKAYVASLQDVPLVNSFPVKDIKVSIFLWGFNRFPVGIILLTINIKHQIERDCQSVVLIPTFPWCGCYY
jgi:hypothetical protein